MSINLKGSWDLSNIVIDEVSLVVAGDNPNARMLIAKAAPDEAATDAAFIEALLSGVGEVAKKGYPSLERVPGVQNWVDRAGGLPKYIEKLAKHFHYERGMDIGRAIATAVRTVRTWAAGGGTVNADTRAKAAAAVAEWEAKKRIGSVAKEFTGGPVSGTATDPARLPSGQVDAPDAGASPADSPEGQDPSMSVPVEAPAAETVEVADAELEAVANAAETVEVAEVAEVEKSGDAVAALSEEDEETEADEVEAPALELATDDEPADATEADEADEVDEVEVDPADDEAEDAPESDPADDEAIDWSGFGLPDEVVEYITATEEANAALTEENASLKAAATAAPVEAVEVEKSAEQAIIEKADPAVRAIIEKAHRERAEAEEIAKAAREDAEVRAYIEKAAPFASLGTPEEMGGYLRAIDTHLPEVVAKGLTERLTALAAQVSKSALFTEQGSEAESTADTSLDAAANAVMAADPSLTREQAVVKAVSDNPALYHAYTDEESN